MAVGSATIHSQSGLQRSCVDVSTLLSKMHRAVIKRGKKVKATVIEECSMLSGAFLDLLDQLLRKHQDATKPCGGFRMFLVADFGQLAPVPDLQANSPRHRAHKPGVLRSTQCMLLGRPLPVDCLCKVVAGGRQISLHSAVRQA